QALGCEAMAPYRHVANKEGTVDGILDLVLDEMEPPSASGHWAEAIRSSAISMHEALERHGWATNLLVSPAGVRPARMNLMETLLTRLDAAGFSEEVKYHAYHVLYAYIFGFSLWEA